MLGPLYFNSQFRKVSVRGYIKGLWSPSESTSKNIILCFSLSPC